MSQTTRYEFNRVMKLCDTTLTLRLGQVSRIKERVEEKEGIPPVQQRLIFGGKQMCVAKKV